MAESTFISVIVAAAFMIFEVFVLTTWIKRREQEKDVMSWLPFRKLFLDSLVHHFSKLMGIANNFDISLEQCLEKIRTTGKLTNELLNELENTIQDTSVQIDEAERNFFYVIQTVSPSLKSYAAQYCNEVLWFSSAFRASLEKSENFVEELRRVDFEDNDKSSHSLNGLNAMLYAVRLWRDHRFKDFKTNFVHSVWKEEKLHYLEEDDQFLPPEDYARALDTERSMLELNKIPRDTPIKPFFES